MTRPVRGDERGVTLILFTLMITVMLVFVALAMDSGLVFNERRQDQSAADAAVLAAAQILLEHGTKTAAVEAIITSSLTNTKSTNDVPLEGTGGWRERWAGCSATIPFGFVPASSSPCIAFRDISPSNDTTKVWAHLPPITVGSTFGGVVGIKEYKSTAEATAEIFIGEPYAVFAAATNCDQQNGVEQVVDIGDTGKQVSINGSVHSNGTVEISALPTGTVTNGEVTYVKGPPQLPAQITSRQTGIETDPLADITIADYVLPGGAKAQAARTSNLYRDAGSGGVDDTWLDDPNNDVLDAQGHLKNVLIYTTGSIDVKVPRQGTATFVSTKQISFNGDGFNLSARAGDVLAFSSAGDPTQCGDPAIRFEGGDNVWNGVVYAPAGTIRSCSGTGQTCSPSGDPSTRTTTFNAGLIAWIVDLDSPGFDIRNDPTLGAPAKVRLFQ